MTYTKLTIYSSYSKEHIICLIFKKLGFFMNIQNVIMWSQVLFQNQTIWNVNVLAQLAQKVGRCVFEWICSQQWSQIFKFKTIWKAFLYSIFQKISDYNAQMFKAQVYSYTYSCKDRVLFQKSTHESVTITELRIAPDLSYHP